MKSYKVIFSKSLLWKILATSTLISMGVMLYTIGEKSNG